MQYQVIKTNAGYAVQNTKTYAIVNVYDSQLDAERVKNNLNAKLPQRSAMVYEIAA